MAPTLGAWEQEGGASDAGYICSTWAGLILLSLAWWLSLCGYWMVEPDY